MGLGRASGITQHIGADFPSNASPRKPTHGRTMSPRSRRSRHHIHILIIIYLPRRMQLPRLPHNRPRPDQLPPVIPIQHRSPRKHNSGNINRRGAHQHGRGRLVATRGQDDTVERVSVEHFHEAQVGKVAV